MSKKRAEYNLSCSVDNCDIPTVRYIRGYCNTHYLRIKRHGSININTRIREYHGMTESSEYTIWSSMIQRCTNPNNTNYNLYGGRGIKVCEQWSNSFYLFYKYMGNRPTSKHTIDRIDNFGNYEPGNVKWSTYTEQVKNRRVNRNNTSGVVGVTWDKQKYFWKAQIMHNYKAISLGRFKDKNDAIKARREAELIYNV